MIIYADNKDSDTQEILHSDIKFLTKQLGEFIKIYEDKIYISSQEDWDTLNKLKLIHQKLANQQYDQLINDPSIIKYDDDINYQDAIDDGVIPF